MKQTCPACGAIASAEAWENDTNSRHANAAMLDLPAPLHRYIKSYLSLFRPQSSALNWAKAHRLTEELLKLVATGNVQVQGKVSRPCPPRIWALAIEQMIERRQQLQRPLKNHNYLRHIAWSLADKEDRSQESRIRKAEGNGSYRHQDGEVSEIMRKYDQIHGRS